MDNPTDNAGSQNGTLDMPPLQPLGPSDFVDAGEVYEADDSTDETALMGEQHKIEAQTADAFVEPKLLVVPSASDIGFFGRNTRPRQEVIQGVIREQQIGVLGGPFGKGKTPALLDMALHVLYGIPWCGRSVEKRPIIYIDHETSGPVFRKNVENIAKRLGVPVPLVPEDMDVYLEQDDPKAEWGTSELHKALAVSDMKPRITLLENALRRKPNALVLLDPMELLFRVDTGKKAHILFVYIEIRRLLSQFPHALLITTFNLRKRDKKQERRPDLLKDPRTWLEEVCGTLDIMNRSDVRLGMDDSLGDEDVRIINGIRRGEEMQPLILRSVDVRGVPATDGELAGFEPVPVAEVDRLSIFSEQQFRYWTKLPSGFRFDDVADKAVPRGSLSRLLKRAESLGMIERSGDGVWRKRGNGGT